MLRHIRKYNWFLVRFGLSPKKIYRRITTPSSGPKIICISLPKSGTHLLERALCLHPHLYRKPLGTLYEKNVNTLEKLDGYLSKTKPGEIIVSHLDFFPERLKLFEMRDIKSVFVIRDPRDIVVSQAFYVPKNTKHYLHSVFESQTSTKARIQLAIEGYPEGGLPSMGQRMQDYLGWLNSCNLTVRFEDLVGEFGGGNLNSQRIVLQQIYNLTQSQISDEWISEVIKNLVSSSSPTFRKGQIGQWEEYFDEELKALFKFVAGDELIRYGYELDHSW